MTRREMHQCSICLTLLEPSDECYLLPVCYHWTFHEKCIEQWTHQQLSTHQLQRNPQRCGDEKTLTCPICRAPYSAFLCPAADRSSFRMIKVSKQADELDDLIEAVSGLKRDELRRRVLLMQLRGLDQLDTTEKYVAKEVGGRKEAEGPRSRGPRRSADDPIVQIWIERELVALLLHRQVGVMVQLVLGLLRARGSNSFGQEMRSEMAPFLGDLAFIFASELDRFMACRLNIQAYDDQRRNDIEQESTRVEPEIDEQIHHATPEESDFLPQRED